MTWTEADLAAHYDRLGLPAAEPVKVPKIPKPRLNKWEAEYDEHLRHLHACGEVYWYAFEPFKLRLAGNTYYTPDFAVVDCHGMHFVEVKGFWRDDALVKFKVAAEHFPFVFCAYRKRKVKEGGGWELIRYINGAAVIAEAQRRGAFK